MIRHHFQSLFAVCRAVAPAMSREQMCDEPTDKKNVSLVNDYSNHWVLSSSLRSCNSFDTFCPPNTRNNPDVDIYHASVTFLHRHVALWAPLEGYVESFAFETSPTVCEEGVTAQECVDRRALECRSQACVYTSDVVQKVPVWCFDVTPSWADRILTSFSAFSSPAVPVWWHPDVRTKCESNETDGEPRCEYGKGRKFGYPVWD